MAKEKKKVPNLRFKGFTDDWEQRKLGEISTSFSGGTPSVKNKSYYGGKIPFIRSAEIHKDKTELFITESGLKNSSAKLIKKGTLLYALYGATSGEVDVSNIDGAINQAIIAIFLQKDNVGFIKYYLEKNKDKILAKYLQGGQGNLSASIIKSVHINLPFTEEQLKISNLIKKVESLISLQQRKLDLLKQLKKGLLQKMFADKDSERPVLRFKGFHDDWEQRRLGEVTSHRGGTAIEKYFDENGEYKVISIGSYGLDSKYVDQNIRAKSNEVTNERVVHAGELTMVLNDKTANGTIIGRSLLIENDNEYVINQRTEIIKPEESFNAKFAYTLLNGPFRNKVKRIVQGGTQIYVNYSSVEKLTVPLPNMKEQQKIGSFFNQLDSLIALHQRKQNHLKLLKKSLLQQMFM